MRPLLPIRRALPIRNAALSAVLVLLAQGSGCHREAPPPPVAAAPSSPAPSGSPSPAPTPPASPITGSTSSPDAPSGVPDTGPGGDPEAGAPGTPGSTTAAGDPGAPSGSGTSDVAGSGATGGKAIQNFDGTSLPSTAADAARTAEAQLDSSREAEQKGSLRAAYHRAARALQAAAAFPQDPTCAALADSARGRLKTLEGRLAASAGSLPRGSSLKDKMLIETP